MDLPQFKEAAARLEAVQQQTAAVEREVAELERQCLLHVLQSMLPHQMPL